MVTIIADNYYGYCKKEVKTQISYAANLFGNCEEEHAGGAIAFPAYVLGQEFYAGRTVLTKHVAFEDAMSLLGDRVEDQPGTLRRRPPLSDIFYVPENAEFRVREGCVRWPLQTASVTSSSARGAKSTCFPGAPRSASKSSPAAPPGVWSPPAPMASSATNPAPFPAAANRRSPNPLGSIILKGPVFVSDYQHDMDAVAEILNKDFSADLQKAAPGRSRHAPHSEPRALSRLGDQAR